MRERDRSGARAWRISCALSGSTLMVRRLRAPGLRAVRGVGFGRLELLLGDPEHRIDGRILPDAHHALRDVVADLRPELESLGVSTGGDPDVGPSRMVIDDEVAARRDLVMTGVGLRDRRVLEERKAVRDEAARAVDALLVRPAIARVRVQLLGRHLLRLAALARAATGVRGVRSGVDGAPVGALGGLGARDRLRRLRRTLAPADAEATVVHRQRRPAGDARKVVAREIGICESLVPDGCREVADVAEGEAHLLGEELGEGLA